MLVCGRGVRILLRQTYIIANFVLSAGGFCGIGGIRVF